MPSDYHGDERATVLQPLIDAAGSNRRAQKSRAH
jgi:hypothetical protein